MRAMSSRPVSFATIVNLSLVDRTVGNSLCNGMAAIFARNHGTEVRWCVLSQQGRDRFDKNQSFLFAFVVEQARINFARGPVEFDDHECERLIVLP